MIRRLKSPVRAVYAAWTEPRLLARWLAPGGDTVTSITMDLRKGGRYRLEGVHGDGRPYSFSGTYLELAEDRRVAMSWIYDGPVAELKGRPSVVVADLRELEPDLTELTVTHEKLAERDAAEIYRVSWTECFCKLDDVVCPSGEADAGYSLDDSPEFYSDGHREMQDRFETRRMADRLEAVLVHDHINAADAAFIARQNMFFMATADAYGQPNCSYKGGARGLVTIVDERTLAFPDYDGNGMNLTVGNIHETSKVGLLFIDFEHQSRIRVLGRATLSEDDPLRSRYPGARLIIRVAVDSVFSNCPRYVHKMQLVEESVYIPKAGRKQPVPEWKRLRTVADVLPDEDKDAAGTDVDLRKTLNKD
jgi:uncharacterized protein YndB with AHSA1/START domain/predicted pyridoxine 5'-phosphate oxidase superfamily flavin-nucleotide-binding protein